MCSSPQTELVGVSGHYSRSHRACRLRQRTPAIDRSDQSACRVAADQEPEPAGARRSLRYSAFRGHRPSPGITDITPYWRPASWAVVGWPSSTRCPGCGPTTGSSSGGTRRRSGPRCCCALMFRLAVRAAPTIHRRRLRPGPHRGPSAASASKPYSARRKLIAISPAATRPSTLRTPSARNNQLPGGMLCWAPGGSDHPAPGQIRGIGPHNSADNTRTGPASCDKML